MWRLFFCCTLWMCSALFASDVPPTLYVRHVQLEGGLSPASLDLLKEALTEAEKQGEAALVVTLDTPGGTITAMRQIVQVLLDPPVPVIVYVAPAGARAASAGTFLVAAASFAVMHPQTTLGAAAPVQIDGTEISTTIAKKTMEDTVSLIRTAAEFRGRNAEWYEEAVREAKSIGAKEAAALGVIDLVAEDLQAALIGAQERRLLPERGTFQITEHNPSMRYHLLAWVLEPQIAYLLLVLGMMGLFLELSNPGSILPGVLGMSSLIVALYALSVLPANVAGILLIALGALFFLLEVFIASYGLLTLAGIVAFIVGSLILFPSYPGNTMLAPTFLLVIGLFAGAFVTLVWLVARSQRSKPMGGRDSLCGLEGRVRQWQGEEGTIFVRGELWKARDQQGQAHAVGSRVRILTVEGLTAVVESVTLPHTSTHH